MLLAFTLALLLFVLPTRVAHATDQRLVLNDFVLDNTEGQLILRFGVSVTDRETLQLLLKDGGKVSLLCEGSLIRPSTLWLDTTLARQQTTSTLFYDVLTKDYVLTDDMGTPLGRTPNLGKLLETTWEAQSLNVGLLSQLTRGGSYRVDLSIQIKDENVPLWMTKTLFFWSWNVAPSMRYSMDFTF